MYKKILIIGDQGRGKTTLARKLSEKLSIPFHDVDDYFWKVKYSEANNIDQAVMDIGRVYDSSEWVMSGATRRLIMGGIEKADIILYLKFRSILVQYFFIVRRSIKRNNERLVDFWKLITHVAKKRYKKGHGEHRASLDELLREHREKVVELHSFKEINKYLDSVGKQ